MCDLCLSKNNDDDNNNYSNNINRHLGTFPREYSVVAVIYTFC